MTIAPPESDGALADAELALATARGDRSAFAAIYDRYADRLACCGTPMLRRTVNPVALLGGASVFLPAPAELREYTLTAASSGLPASTGVAGQGVSPTRYRHVRAALIAVFVVLGIAGVALTSDASTPCANSTRTTSTAPPSSTTTTTTTSSDPIE